MNTDPKEFIVTYGLIDDTRGGIFDYKVFESIERAMEVYEQTVKDGAITADVSIVIKSTETRP